MNEAKLQRRDWLILPLLSLLTISLATISTDLIARRVFSESPPFVKSCLVPGASWAGARAIPNSVCWDKKYESQMVEYKFNSCGHRTPLECGAERPGIYRIVLTGSSFAMGHLTQEDKTFAELLPVSLAQRTGSKVELYNEGMVGLNPHVFALRFNEVLAAKPDLILWTLTPWDIQNVLPPDDLPNPDARAGPLAKVWFRIKATFTTKSIPDAIRFVCERFWQEWQRKFADSAVAALLQHFIYESKSQYIRSSLMAGDPAGYLETRPSMEWQSRLRQFDRDASDIERRARAIGVPVVAVLIPSRAQAAMISVGEWPAGYDPYKLDDELRPIIVSHGGIYIDIFPEFRAVPNPEQYYFPVDGHPNAGGHAMISGMLTKELTSGAVPALRTVAQPLASSEQVR